MQFSQVAILGAGVMGAQIAAHCANAGVNVVLFDLPGTGKDPHEIVKKAIAAMKKLEPAPFAAAELADYIEIANYDNDLDKLRSCDLIIEAIAEKMLWKQELYQKIGPYINQQAVIASNTSGLSINALAQFLLPEQRSRFCGIHFFNPPRYMALVEIIATKHSDNNLLDNLESWLVTRLGKRIVRAKDTPNFIANRIGVFAICAVMHHTARLNLGFDEVDALTGPLIGRPKSASFRTIDVVGIDTLSHVIATLAREASDDSWQQYYQIPQWMQQLIANGAIGQKVKCGIYRKQGKSIQVLNSAKGDYVESQGQAADEVVAILKEKNPVDKFAKLRASEHPQAQLLWSIFRDTFHYSACLLNEIAENARDVDQAMRWGFGWSHGPFEIWQSAGWENIASAIAADITAGVSMSKRPLPAWVNEISAAHGESGSWSASANTYQARQSLQVYQRQLTPPRLLGEKMGESGKTIFSNDGIRLWQHPSQPQIAIASITSKMHSLGAAVLEGLNEAVSRAESEYRGLVIWQEAPFAVGANLKEVAEQLATGDFALLNTFVDRFQQTMMRIKYAKVPVVSAVSGMALGGGCELLMSCAHRVAALESYIGLVEVGVGLIPAGGGCKEFALHFNQAAAKTANRDPLAFLDPIFNQIAMAKTSKSALEAKKLSFLRMSDTIVMNSDEILYVALAQAYALAESCYHPPLMNKAIPVLGRTGIANCEMALVNMQDGGFISAHDYRVSKAVATALCGGEIDSGTAVSEQWLLDVERSLFVELLQSKETQARITHMLETGKPLRN